MIHDLKILSQYFEDIVMGRKNFELRKDDGDFAVGDEVILREWDGEYTGKRVHRYISYVLRNCPEYGLMEGYCIIGLKNGRPTATLDEFRERSKRDSLGVL